MTTTINPLYPHAPDDAARRIGEPVTQETLRAFVDAVNHLAVVRSLRRFSHHVGWKPTTAFAQVDSHVIYDDPQSLNEAQRLTWQAGPYAQRLALIIAYQASPVSSTTPNITATLTTRAGADLDDPGGGVAVTWTAADGTLDTSRVPYAGPGPVFPFAGTPPYIPEWEYPLLEVSTGVVSVGDIRTLDISSGAGLAVELVIAFEAVRVHRIDVLELTPESV